MALPTNHKFTEVQAEAYSPSVGASPVTAYTRAPFRGKIIKLGAVLYGTLTGDATVACTINGTAVTGGTLTLTASGSAGGSTFTAIPTAAFNVNEDDYISFPPSGGNGTSIAAAFFAVVDKAGV
jgi:hypothetical protein